jgi:competence protein ComEC
MALVEADSTWTPSVKGGRWFNADAWANAYALEAQRLTVWSPLLLVAGIWSYFALSREPPTWVALPVALVCITAILWIRTPVFTKILAIIVLGFVAAQLRTQWVATPLLRAYSPQQLITGTVADVDVRSRLRFTVVIAIKDAENLPVAERPRRVFVTVTGKNTAPQVGDVVRLTADLAPLPRPAQPGAFDYGRQLYFQSIGATGRSKTAIEVLDQPRSLRFTIKRAFHVLRAAIGDRVKAAIPGPLGSFADALITGERATIPRAMNESLQSSGLFHILSISGLHMALVAGGAFWSLRAGLALSPRLASLYPIKKWAASFAIFVGLLYMLLADSGAATERSFIMIAVVFFAVLVDRPALSMHNLALAAVLILLLSPEQALAASFQMSFMAVMGLAAFLQWWKTITPEHRGRRRAGLLATYGRKVVLIAFASLGTSLVAGVLSGIPAAHHFGRLAPYSVVANALALPIVSLIVMPAAMASVILMPLGMEGIALKVMGWGLQAVMLVSDWVASWPAAGLRLPFLNKTVSATLAIAMTFLLLPLRKLKWLSLPCFMFAATLYFSSQEKPLLLIDERSGNVAVWTEQGLVPALPKQAAASVSRWLSQAGDNAGFKKSLDRRAWTCSTLQCETLQSGLRITFVLKQPNGIISCPKTDILVSQEPLRRRCKGRLVTVDRFDVWRNGAYAVFANGALLHSKAEQGARPWVYEPRARIKP